MCQRAHDFFTRPKSQGTTPVFLLRIMLRKTQHSLRENPGFIEKVKGFLSSGLSDSPKNIFINLGVDITDSGFRNKRLDEVDNLLGETIENYPKFWVKSANLFNTYARL
jgi:hypothetical protein